MALLWPQSLLPFSQQDMPYLSLLDMSPIKPEKGAVGWEIFATTQEKYKVVKHDGLTDTYSLPQFSPEMQKLNGQNIRLTGFMFPLEQSEHQQRFLFGPFPPSCPFHYHAINALIVTVSAKKPIAFTLDPLTLSGTLKLTGEAGDGDFYHLEQAIRVSD